MLIRFIDQDGTEEIISVDSIKRITAWTDPDPGHEAKKQLPKKYVHIHFNKGKYYDEVMYEIRECDWRDLWNAIEKKGNEVWGVTFHVTDTRVRHDRETQVAKDWYDAIEDMKIVKKDEFIVKKEKKKDGKGITLRRYQALDS